MFQLILNVVVDSERNGGYVNKSRFYSLVAQRIVKGEDTVSYLHINADKWLLSHEMGYAGFLIIRGVYFLLRGDLESCGLLKKCEGVGDTIRLQRPVSNEFKTFTNACLILEVIIRPVRRVTSILILQWKVISERISGPGL